MSISSDCRLRTVVAAVFLMPLAGPMTADAQAQPQVTTQVIATGLQKPVYLTHAPGDPDRVFILEQPGRIRVVRDGVMLATPFLDVSSLAAATLLEHGLLCLAFHPDYERNGCFYITYTEPPQATAPLILARFNVSASSPDVANLSSQSVVLRIPQTTVLHRGGWIGFGPDGYLYMSTGDGGPENDTQDHGSRLNTLRGKLLRLDVDGPDNIPATADDDEFPADANRNYHIPADNPFVRVPEAMPEIWAYGLRNPWRCSFDRQTGDLWIADVGQFQREEINFQPASSKGGEFYGWRCMEGTLNFGACSAPTVPSVPPVFQYNTAPAASVTGGYMYRGCAMPNLDGMYFFGDWLSGAVRAFHYTPQSGVTNFTVPMATLPNGPSSFGEDLFGELYGVCYAFNGGSVVKLVPVNPASGRDCNRNGISDACDISGGLSTDLNDNGVPDDCESLVTGDLNGDGVVNGVDLGILLSQWFTPGGSADLNGDRQVNGIDLGILLANWTL